MDGSVLSQVDELIKDYLSFRGFAASLKNFEIETKKELDCKYRVDRIVEEVVQSVDTYDIDRLVAIWHFLNTKIFNSLTEVIINIGLSIEEQSKVASRLEEDVNKLFLVNCIQRQQKAKCNLFLERMSEEMQSCPDWFSLPFVADPANNEKFQKNFSKSWQQLLLISLHNLISIALQRIQLPALAACVKEAVRAGNASDPVEVDSKPDLSASLSLRHCMEDSLMDDFSIIAQCSSTSKNNNQSRSSLKAILKSITSKKT